MFIESHGLALDVVSKIGEINNAVSITLKDIVNTKKTLN